jgi:hypothetical protein
MPAVKIKGYSEDFSGGDQPVASFLAAHAPVLAGVPQLPFNLARRALSEQCILIEASCGQDDVVCIT